MSFRDQITDIFELPPEVINNVPLLMIMGQKKLYLENHNGIAHYQNEMIKIKVNKGQLVIKGRQLEIKKINTEEIIISGTLINLDFNIRFRGKTID